MPNKTKQLSVLNILASFSISILGGYWAVTLLKSSDLGANDKDIISILIAGAIIITTIIIVGLLIYSTMKLNNGIYKERVQKIATVLFICFGVVSDLFVVRFFGELSVISKIIFIYFHVLIISHSTFSFKKLSD